MEKEELLPMFSFLGHTSFLMLVKQIFYFSTVIRDKLPTTIVSTALIKTYAGDQDPGPYHWRLKV